jgi:hypothetical protein
LFSFADGVGLSGEMDRSQHYSLRWNNHQHHLLAAFDALLQVGEQTPNQTKLKLHNQMMPGEKLLSRVLYFNKYAINLSN